MRKQVISLCGMFAYLIGLLGLTSFILYLGGWSFLPLHINSQVAESTSSRAVLINLSIVFLFGLHHSVAARRRFKQKLTRILPPELERSSYVMVSGLFLLVLCAYWQPLAGTVWSVDNALIAMVLKAVHVLGWIVLLAATFEIDHFRLMGLKQSMGGDSVEDKQLRESFLYGVVRHPIQTGVLMGIWATGYMSLTQFMLATCLTIYMVIGLYYEEKSLIAHFGEAYRDYRKRVPAVIPFWPMR